MASALETRCTIILHIYIIHAFKLHAHIHARTRTRILISRSICLVFNYCSRIIRNFIVIFQLKIIAYFLCVDIFLQNFYTHIQCTKSRAHNYIHFLTNIRIHTDTHNHTHTRLCARLSKCKHRHTHTHTYTHTHTHTHTYARTHTHTIYAYSYTALWYLLYMIFNVLDIYCVILTKNESDINIVIHCA